MAIEPRDRSGRMYHVSLRKGDVGRVAFLPGDPGRVPIIAEHFKEAKLVASHREYTTYGGRLGGEYVTATSTGIGGPSAAIAVEELARLGVKVMIRVGTCGGIRSEAKVGSVVIADAAVRMEGTSGQYAMAGYPAAATPGVVMALADTAASLKKRHLVGLAASTDSFYVGQGRKGFGGYFPSDKASLVKDLREARVLCFEMESSTLFTLGRIFGLKTGALFAVVANRETDEFRPDAGLDDTIEVAVNSVRKFKKYGV
ncbi:MAG: nucleoside phosphorylase [Nitrososphaerales archaeon]|nr:nucleoside phosphorylase [Nitrososphaerales archaeon]